ncbi:MAG TPA: isocitrate/isopropylmalate family dehydrogenase [Candidatus Saccharicenans sp.]|nr:isocitrate/isopropylmalate family dehydrogenase [Candidatus Saccharicenans sp.]HOJ26365.1 isocitrate/isopropylmalate family dehydrogenase [Candidatus Saccharicenans sp.]HOL44992.1 isocitrate/isopropylmalate family dehydrogenase [Candidatus Saccharicenans sp.]HOM93586.1 isocitrate/isopropylmalate family dehydrogenase [Candidatus Saccharicenans sp.]HOP61520.1 isocitrate/isopropylmalate family dehydrogenase [Candidatus Saccharicenans sp.]
MNQTAIQKAKDHFGRLLENQMLRMEKIKSAPDWIDYRQLSPIKIGILPGDGIGPYIATEAERVLRFMLEDELKKGKVFIATIEGLTIENRAAHNKAIPDDVLEEIKKFHVTLKGPTTTPRKGDPWPNIESCNVAMRKELDLFANVRPVRVPKQGIDWIFFRENTEDLYALGPYGIDVDEDISIDFKLITGPGSERICRLAFEHARKNKKNRITCVTKANVVKTTDGRFLENFYRLAKEYPEIQADDWYIDIMTAKLVDEKRRREFQVFVLPNLYGDILTDEAAEFQGGVGTAGSANIGKQYAMFEAIHGSAPRMVKEGRAQYADPASMIRAAAMLIGHIGFEEKAAQLEMALDICGQYEKKLVITGRSTGATGKEFTDYLLDWLKNPKLKETWESYVNS